MADYFYVTWQSSDERVEIQARQILDLMIRSTQIDVAERVDSRRVEDGTHIIETLVEHGTCCPCFDCTGIAPPPPAVDPLDPLEYYRMIIDRGGGIVTLSEHLGVFVSDDPVKTPPGWLFVDIRGLTAEALQAWVEAARAGRAAWPENTRLESGTIS